jgi:hypothetical protein
MVVGFTSDGSNLTHGEVYSIPHYVIKFVGDLQQVTLVSLTNLRYN